MATRHTLRHVQHHLAAYKLCSKSGSFCYTTHPFSDYFEMYMNRYQKNVKVIGQVLPKEEVNNDCQK